ncbi:MAG TPA: M24 family metallopeptidase [Dermatophilaceae bacterium]|nr:M24 family metallopeptidase [Dermatophilaceae bacterium]
MADRWDDLPEKLGGLCRIAAEAGLDTLVLREPATLAWLFEARVHVPLTLDAACLEAVVHVADPPGLTVVTNAIEAPRLQDTELAGLPAEWLVLPWWQPRDAALPTGPQVGGDRPGLGTVDVRAGVAAVRRVLTPRQRDLLAAVGRDAACAATRTALRVTPATSEYAAAGLFAAELMSAGMDPVVLMVAGGTRGGRHRHPLPTADPVGSRAMLVCCARRDGLIASVTRIVSFDPLSRAQEDTYRRLLLVERAFLDATQPGTQLAAAFSAGAAAYRAQGFDPQEWHRHHQGGLSGLQPREFPAHHDSEVVLREGMVAAWNPSAAGWKVEDTAVIRAGGPDLLVHDPEWPCVEVGGRARPGVLLR